MTHTLKSADKSPAMHPAIQSAIAAEHDGALAGFALADIPAPCISVVAVGKDTASAERAAEKIAMQIWAYLRALVWILGARVSYF